MNDGVLFSQTRAVLFDLLANEVHYDLKHAMRNLMVGSHSVFRCVLFHISHSTGQFIHTL